MINKDIFQEDDGQWYFYDECQLDTIGPFRTLELAEQTYHAYGKWLDDGKPPIKKMKHSMGT